MKLSLVLTAALLLGACSKNIQTTEAVHDSVMEYLNAKAAQTGLDMSAMQVDVASVSFEKNEARATISVKPRNFPTSPMQIAYVLDRKGDKWVVRGPVASDVNGHGGVAGGAAMPAGHPTVDPKAPGAATSKDPLPPGHPPIGDAK